MYIILNSLFKTHPNAFFFCGILASFPTPQRRKSRLSCSHLSMHACDVEEGRPRGRETERGKSQSNVARYDTKHSGSRVCMDEYIQIQSSVSCFSITPSYILSLVVLHHPKVVIHGLDRLLIYGLFDKASKCIGNPHCYPDIKLVTV